MQAQGQLKRAPLTRKEGKQERKGGERAVGRLSDGVRLSRGNTMSP